MTGELKSCPFCGSEDVSIGGWRECDMAYVLCNECGCRTDVLATHGAIEAWNRRVDIDDLDAIVKEEESDG